MKYQEYTRKPNHGRRSAADIESDVRVIQSELSETLERLERRFSPRAVLELLLARGRRVGDGSSEFVGNLGATVRDHPIPVLLLAAGTASLVASQRLASREGEIRERREGMDGEEPEDTERGPGAVRTRGRPVAARMREAAGELGERAGELGERARQRREQMRARMRGAMSEANAYGQRTVQDEPLVVLGLFFAFGAMLGGSLPISHSERRAFGPARERVLRRAREAARGEAEREHIAARTPPPGAGSSGV